MSDFRQGLPTFLRQGRKKCVSSHRMMGWEAYLWLRHWLERDGGVLEDPAVDYLAERVDEMDAAALLEAMGLIRKRLAAMGSPA